MKTLNFRNLLALSLCIGIFGSVSVASAQSVRHDKMDLQAAKRDLARLQKDRKRAVKYGNWGKVAQDDRLIASDKLFIMKDRHRVQHAH